MEAIVFYPKDEDQLKQLTAFAEETKMDHVKLSGEEKKKLAGILLANLAKRNPKAYATMDEIISVVEEVRSENFYGKKDNNS
ncbi:MAG: hypothetical protein M3O67_10265 [Bacteroidota bacterium]|nr:hypothetical protein [Bacteroidota bacterium]